MHTLRIVSLKKKLAVLIRKEELNSLPENLLKQKKLGLLCVRRTNQSRTRLGAVCERERGNTKVTKG